MTTGADVLDMLLPLGGWVITGDIFENIIWTDSRARCTKAQFEAGFAQYDTWQAKQEADKAAAKATAETKLRALGLTADDLKALGL